MIPQSLSAATIRQPNGVKGGPKRGRVRLKRLKARKRSSPEEYEYLVCDESILTEEGREASLDEEDLPSEETYREVLAAFTAQLELFLRIYEESSPS